MSVVEAPPRTLGEEANEARPNHWLEHTEGFQVFGPNGRIGFVELVVRPEEGADGLVIRTGLFRTWTVFVPSHEVGAVLPGTRRLELLIAPRASGECSSDFVRELAILGGLSNSASGEATRAFAT